MIKASTHTEMSFSGTSRLPHLEAGDQNCCLNQSQYTTSWGWLGEGVGVLLKLPRILKCVSQGPTRSDNSTCCHTKKLKIKLALLLSHSILRLGGGGGE